MITQINVALNWERDCLKKHTHTYILIFTIFKEFFSYLSAIQHYRNNELAVYY